MLILKFKEKEFEEEYLDSLRMDIAHGALEGVEVEQKEE